MQNPLKLLVLVFAITVFATSVSAQDYDYPPDAGDQPAYHGIPPKGKVEGTLGSYNLRFYGTVLLNMSVSDTPTIGGDVPLWASPGSIRTAFIDGTSKRVDEVHDTIFTARQSIFGF